MLCLTWLVLLMMGSACGSEPEIPSTECDQAADCGDEGWSLCVSGACHVFDLSTGYASATVNLSFPRERIAYSGYIHFILGTMPDGGVTTCDDVLQGRTDVNGQGVNPLLLNPETGARGKYLVFHWTGGTFFPNNLVQFIRPGEPVLAVAMGYSQGEGEGVLTCIGCSETLQDQPMMLMENENISFTINMEEPGF